MKRSHYFTALALSGAAAAWLGWQTGRPAAEPEAKQQSAAPVETAGPVTVNPAYAAAAAPEFDARGKLSVKEMLALLDSRKLDAFSQCTVDDGISGELFAQLFALNADEIPEVLEHLNALPPPCPDKLLAAVLGRWASFDGPAAIKWIEQLPPVRQDRLRGAVLSGWAGSDPAAAWKWYQAAFAAAPEPRYRLEQDFPLLIHAWAMRDLPGALDACLAEGKHGTFDPWAGLASLAALPEKREALMQILASIPDEKARKSASSSALRQWAASAPADAAAWIDANLPNADSNLLWTVAERYGRANPRANADWLLKRTPVEKRDEIYSLCLYQWAEVNVDEAASWLEQAGPTDDSLQIIAGSYVRRNLDQAVSWAQRVSQGKRAEAVSSVLAQAVTNGQKPDPAKYAAAAGVSPEALGKLMEAAAARFGSRL